MVPGHSTSIASLDVLGTGLRSFVAFNAETMNNKTICTYLTLYQNVAKNYTTYKLI